ncbi:phage holin family protein [Nocardioides jiangxiensis]|uniref:Phage holin family protein n=1 Tax=Nocardioides jiangxiensis TaxID=3064524 RepID=A0ABT9B0L0_9ACTN|nr:phage holin family protein [Nocardioides sp. WY-20]MDO7868399.1 phage holin family protein [Nocardioides sp. WY-20]
MKLLIWIASTMAGLAVAAWLFDGIRVEGADWQHRLPPLLAAAVLLGLVSTLVEPVVKFFSFPVIILTIGLFLLVINALMLLLTSWLAEQLDVGFHVEGFWTALFGSVIITLVGSFARAVLHDDGKDRS